MLMRKTALTLGILLIVCIFLVISPRYASAQKLAVGIKTLYQLNNPGAGYTLAISGAYEFYAKNGFQSTSFEGRSKPSPKWRRPSCIIFGSKQNITCAIALYWFHPNTIAFISVASNNRDEAKKMRDMIMEHMVSSQGDN